MYIVLPAGNLRDASLPAYRHKGILIDGAFAEPQGAVYFRNGNTTVNGPVNETAKARKSAHYARPIRISFDKRSFKLTTSTVEIWAPRQER